MRITILPSEQSVTIDGLTRRIEISSETATIAASIDAEDPPEIHAIQWDAGRGEIEFDGRGNHGFRTLDLVRPIIDRFHAAAPVETIEDARNVKRRQVRAEALRRIGALDPRLASPVTINVLDALWPALEATAPPAFAKAREIQRFCEDVLIAAVDGETTIAKVKAINPKKAKPIAGEAWPR